MVFLFVTAALARPLDVRVGDSVTHYEVEHAGPLESVAADGWMVTPRVLLLESGKMVVEIEVARDRRIFRRPSYQTVRIREGQSVLLTDLRGDVVVERPESEESRTARRPEHHNPHSEKHRHHRERRSHQSRGGEHPEPPAEPEAPSP